MSFSLIILDLSQVSQVICLENNSYSSGTDTGMGQGAMP